MLGWLAAHYDVVPLHEFVDRLTRGAVLRSLAAVTFDDGYTGVFEHAVPILDALGIPATVFIVADAVGAATRRSGGDGSAVHRSAVLAEDLRRAWPGHPDLGAHSVNHRSSLPILDDADLEHEVVTSRATIHRATAYRGLSSLPIPTVTGTPVSVTLSERPDIARPLTLDFGLNGSGADQWALRRINGIPADISRRGIRIVDRRLPRAPHPLKRAGQERRMGTQERRQHLAGNADTRHHDNIGKLHPARCRLLTWRHILPGGSSPDPAIVMCENFEDGNVQSRWDIGGHNGTYPVSEFVKCTDDRFGFNDRCAAWSNRLVFDHEWGFYGHDARRSFSPQSEFYVRWVPVYFPTRSPGGPSQDKSVLLHDVEQHHHRVRRHEQKSSSR